MIRTSRPTTLISSLASCLATRPAYRKYITSEHRSGLSSISNPDLLGTRLGRADYRARLTPYARWLPDVEY
jgi:hypothetical protein